MPITTLILADLVVTLQVVDAALLVGGVVALVGLAVWLARRGRWRNPLADLPTPRSGPHGLSILAVVLAYVALQQAALSLVERPAGSSDSEPTPGSVAWHEIHSLDTAVRALLVPLMVAFMRATDRPRAVRLRRPLVSAVAVLLALLPVTACQAELGGIVWRWFHPGQPPPLHAVLRALGSSEWGRWGTVELLVGALLVAPLAEELFFRGVVLGGLCYHFGHSWLAITVSALAFGLVHTQPQDVLPLTTMGIALGVLRLRYGRIWPCVVVHVLFNARTMTLVLLAPELLEKSG